MKRREFINRAGIVTLGVSTIPLIACNPKKANEVVTETTEYTEFTLPGLGYSFDALAPSIDAKTMEIHHGKHHAGYVTKLNNALAEHPLKGKSLQEICANVSESDSDTGVRNNGGGHYNHSLFWNIMKPGGSKVPTSDLLDLVNKSFGSVEKMSEQFASAASTVFGSGWAWLAVDKNKNLFISSTANQDNPLMTKIVEKAGTPILGIDVWEHAYYLNYQNKRKDYITSFLGLINWDQVADNLKNIG